MVIEQITTIALEKTEIAALQTLKDAYMQCVIEDNFECDQCPLYVDKICIGEKCEKTLDKQESR